MSNTITNYIENKSKLDYLTNKHSNINFELALGSKGIHLPGATHLIRAPFQLLDGMKAAHQAYKIGDEEALFENHLKVLQTPLSFANAALHITRYTLYLGILFKVIEKVNFEHLLNRTTPFSKAITAIGLGVCAIERISQYLLPFQSL